MTRWTAARCTASVSKRRGNRRTSERVGSHRAVRGAGRQRRRSARLAEARSGSSQASFSAPATGSVRLRQGVGSAARSILGREPARHPPASQRKASGTIAITQGMGPEAAPPVSPRLFGPWASARAKSGAGPGLRVGPLGGTVTDPRRIDDQSVIGPAGDLVRNGFRNGARTWERLGQDKESLHAPCKSASPRGKS
jgi:hypothetical protein